MENQIISTSPPPTKSWSKVALEGPFKEGDERCKLFTNKGFFVHPIYGRMVSVGPDSPKKKIENNYSTK